MYVKNTPKSGHKSTNLEQMDSDLRGIMSYFQTPLSGISITVYEIITYALF